jgi:DNA-binding transcriptional LysR family regulator
VARHIEAELRAHPNVPGVLISALVGHGGWERLQRFAVIARFSTLTAAAEHLGRGVAVTGAHIARLEKDFGARLLTERPLRCTEFGEDVLAAVHQLAEHGGP